MARRPKNALSIEDAGNPYNPLSAADVWEWHKQNAADAWKAAQDPQTWRDAAQQYGQALLAGSIGPEMKGVPMPKWFGQSKIVDESGAPRVVYHGTRADKPVEKFSQAEAEKTGRWNADADNGLGFHFSEDPEIAAGYGKVGQYHLKMENPHYLDEGDVRNAQNKWLNDISWSGRPEDESLADFIDNTKAFDNPNSGYYNYGLNLIGQSAKEAGHDGLVFSRQKDFLDDTPVNEYVVFHPDNIKPAK